MQAADKALGTGRIRRGRYLLECREQRRRLAGVDCGRRHQPEGTVLVLVVVLVKQPLPARASTKLPNLSGKVGWFLTVLNCASEIWGVIRPAWSGQSGGDPQIGVQQCQRLCSHRATPVGVDGQLARRDALPVATLSDVLFSQGSALARRDQPADHEAAEQIWHDVQVEEQPRQWPRQLGDVPSVVLIGDRGQYVQLIINWVVPLVSVLDDFRVFVQNSVHGRHRIVVDPFTRSVAYTLDGAGSANRSLSSISRTATSSQALNVRAGGGARASNCLPFDLKVK